MHSNDTGRPARVRPSGGPTYSTVGRRVSLGYTHGHGESSQDAMGGGQPRNEAGFLYQMAHEGEGKVTSSGVAPKNDVLWGQANGPSQRASNRVAGNCENSSGMCLERYSIANTHTVPEQTPSNVRRETVGLPRVGYSVFLIQYTEMVEGIIFGAFSQSLISSFNNRGVGSESLTSGPTVTVE